MHTITLTTDFGVDDWFVGTMKGVIMGIDPDARIIDITHQITPGDVRGGAFTLAAAARYFPKGTIHVVVIDPGVGSDRNAVALKTADAVFVGPDNGVLSWAARDATIEDVREISNAAWLLQPVSHTFHGRDVFAPVAAHLATGAAFADVGESISEFVKLPWPDVKRGERRLTGEIMHIDRFGNAITNIPAGALPELTTNTGAVCLGCSGMKVSLHAFYAAVGTGEPLALVGSTGFVELSVNGGNFAQRHKIKVGEPVEAAW